MTIKYYGNRPDKPHYTRCALIEINYKHEYAEATRLASLAVHLRMIGWNVDDCVFGMLIVSVDDKEHYAELVQDYKAIKHIITHH